MIGSLRLRYFLQGFLLILGIILSPISKGESINSTVKLPVYERVSDVSGYVSSIGSDTLSNLMSHWVEAFHRLYPNVHINVQAGGSSTAPTALIQGSTQIGTMSRPMKSNELLDFKQRHGYYPTAIKVALDALVVFVHQDNPIQSLTFGQLDAMFSRTLRCGENTPIVRWQDLGVMPPLGEQPIQMFGRNSVSGTYGFFKQNALCRGDFKNQVNELLGSAAVVQAVSKSVKAIGYSGLGQVKVGVKMLPISKAHEPPQLPTHGNILNRHYPLSRYLYLYINKSPTKPLPKAVQEFIRFVLSQQGQALVARDGYIPLPNDMIEKSLKQL